MKSAENRFFCPRLSEARQLLPLIRRNLKAAASRRPLATVVDLVPIVEDGLFGYELVPDRETHTSPILGCNAQGEPVLHKTSYGVGAPGALELVAVNGRLLSRGERAARYTAQIHEIVFSEWRAATEAAWEQLVALYPDLPRRTSILRENMQRDFEKALSIAHPHLLRWDRFIQFFGLPDEAQMGFTLTGTGDERGELRFQQPGTWALHWSAPPEVVDETWSITPDDWDASNGEADGNLDVPDRPAHNRRRKDRRKARGRRATDQKNL